MLACFGDLPPLGSNQDHSLDMQTNVTQKIESLENSLSETWWDQDVSDVLEMWKFYTQKSTVNPSLRNVNSEIFRVDFLSNLEIWNVLPWFRIDKG